MKKLISITLDKDVFEKVKKKIQVNGGKVSTLINELLKRYLKEDK